jgi:ABC-2 type transport system permease protein
MTALGLIRLAAWREIYSRRKAFLITTAIAVTLVVGGLVAASITGADDGPPTIAVGIVDPDAVQAMEAEIPTYLYGDVMVSVENFERVEGMELLRSEQIDALVVDAHHVFWAPSAPRWILDTVVSAMSSVNLEAAAADLGLDATAIAALQAPIVGETVDYEPKDEGVILVSVITVIVMFLAILAYGQWIAYGVVEEKANRVAELILGAITPTQLLTAKMIALGGLGLAQMTVVAGAGLATASMLDQLDVPDAAASAWVWSAFWFILGFAFYGSVYAAAGSLAADSQEAGSVITPLNILPGLGYVVGVIAFSSGAEGVSRIMSLIPFWTPMLMPGRIASGSVEPWELALATALMIAATTVVVRVGARIYLGGITQATRQVSWRQALRSGRDLVSSEMASGS